MTPTTNFLHWDWTIYYGEIYNYIEIRKELSKSGYDFFSISDTEVTLKAFRHWGIGALQRFIGMLAFAIYDSFAERLPLVMDRAGVKPLFYCCCNHRILFASELKSLTEHSGFLKEIDVDSLSLFLQFGYIPAPHYIHRNIRKLRPCHFHNRDLKKRIKGTEGAGHN